MIWFVFFCHVSFFNNLLDFLFRKAWIKIVFDDWNYSLRKISIFLETTNHSDIYRLFNLLLSFLVFPCAETAFRLRKKLKNPIRQRRIGFLLCPERDSNPHARSTPPPQDGLSTNFSTWAIIAFNFYLIINLGMAIRGANILHFYWETVLHKKKRDEFSTRFFAILWSITLLF